MNVHKNVRLTARGREWTELQRLHDRAIADDLEGLHLPTSTMFASHAKESGCWRSTRTPFDEVTTGLGLVISAFQPGRLTRLRIAAAMKESSSLKPSKVRTVIRKVARDYPGGWFRVPPAASRSSSARSAAARRTALRSPAKT